MKTRLLVSACLSSIFMCCAAAVGQEPKYELHDYALDDKKVVDFEELNVTFGAITLLLGKGSLVPIETDQGPTGVVIIAPGQVRYEVKENGEVLEESFDRALLRFHPDDYETVIKLDKPEPHEDSAFAEKATPVLGEYFRMCYRQGNKAIIPAKGNQALVIRGRKSGMPIVMNNLDSKALIYPTIKDLKLRQEVLDFRADDTLARDEKWRQDIQFLSKALTVRHPNLFFRMEQEDFEEEVNSLSKDVGTMSDFQIYVALCKLVAKIGDGHTRIPRANVLVHVYPIGVRWLQDGLFVDAADEQYKQMLGARIVGIGDSTSEKALAAIATMIPQENESFIRRHTISMVTIAELLKELGVTSEATAADFTLEGKDGKRFKVRMQAVSQRDMGRVKWVLALNGDEPSLPITRQKRTTPDWYWYEYLDDAKAVYFYYGRCAEFRNRPMAPFIEELLAFVESHPVERFIFEIRTNGGGSSPLISPLISGLSKSKVNEKGRLFCLIGRMTYSSAVLNAIQLDRQTEAIFVGGPTGGRPNHYGQYEIMMLPHSKIPVQCSTKYFTHSDRDTPGFMPDILVESSSEDYFAGKDPAFEAVLAYKPEKH